MLLIVVKTLAHQVYVSVCLNRFCKNSFVSRITYFICCPSISLKKCSMIGYLLLLTIIELDSCEKSIKNIPNN